MAQVVGFSLTPIISRLFSPSDFGILGSFNAVLNIIAAAATLEYTQAIILQRKKEDAINLFAVSCLCTLAVAFFTLIFCLLAPEIVHGIMKTEGIWLLLLLIIGIIVTGLNSACQVWCVRAKAFKHTSASQVIRSLSANGTQIGLGYLKIGAPGLIIANVLADILASLTLFRVLLPDLIALRPCIQWNRMKQLAIEYRDFPMYAATQNVVSTLSSGLPVLLLTQYYGITVGGAYAFGVRILQVPMGFILRPLRQVLLQKASETQLQKGNMIALYVKITVGLFAISILPTFILFIWAPKFFIWIFGSQWHMAGEFAKYLILWLMVAFCNPPAVLFAQVIRIQRTVLFYDLVVLATRILILVLGGMYLNEVHTIMLFSFVGSVLNLFLIFLVGYAVMKKEAPANIE